MYLMQAHNYLISIYNKMSEKIKEKTRSFRSEIKNLIKGRVDYRRQMITLEEIS